MRIKSVCILLPLLLVFIASCGGNPTPPDQYQLFVEWSSGGALSIHDNSDKRELARKIYEHIQTLPKHIVEPECISIAGDGYSLTISKGNAVVVKASIDYSECGQIVLEQGEKLSPDSSFWSLMAEADKISPKDTTPTPNKLEITRVDVNGESQHVIVDDQDLLWRLYLHPRSFQALEENKKCPSQKDASYTLTFSRDNVQVQQMSADKSGCGTFGDPSDVLGVRQADTTFWLLLDKAWQIQENTK